MKKLQIIFLLLLISSGTVFAEDIKVKTGDVFGNSMTDYFTQLQKESEAAGPVFPASKMLKRIYGALH